MTGNRQDTAPAWGVADEEPELRRGRRPLENPKKAISLRVDADVLERFRNDGPGWQSRMNDALRKAVGL